MNRRKFVKGAAGVGALALIAPKEIVGGITKLPEVFTPVNSKVIVSSSLVIDGPATIKEISISNPSSSRMRCILKRSGFAGPLRDFVLGQWEHNRWVAADEYEIEVVEGQSVTWAFEEMEESESHSMLIVMTTFKPYIEKKK